VTVGRVQTRTVTSGEERGRSKRTAREEGEPDNHEEGGTAANGSAVGTWQGEVQYVGVTRRVAVGFPIVRVVRPEYQRAGMGYRSHQLTPPCGTRAQTQDARDDRMVADPKCAGAVSPVEQGPWGRCDAWVTKREEPATPHPLRSSTVDPACHRRRCCATGAFSRPSAGQWRRLPVDERTSGGGPVTERGTRTWRRHEKEQCAGSGRKHVGSRRRRQRGSGDEGRRVGGERPVDHRATTHRHAATPYRKGNAGAGSAAPRRKQTTRTAAA